MIVCRQLFLTRILGSLLLAIVKVSRYCDDHLVNGSAETSSREVAHVPQNPRLDFLTIHFLVVAELVNWFVLTIIDHSLKSHPGRFVRFQLDFVLSYPIALIEPFNFN